MGTTTLLTLGLLGIAVAFLAVRVILIKGGEFKGTCATQNPLLSEEGVACGVCGRMPGEPCKEDAQKNTASTPTA